jgi:hypothetical protein
VRRDRRVDEAVRRAWVKHRIGAAALVMLLAACQSSGPAQHVSVGDPLNYSVNPSVFTLTVGAECALTLSRGDTVIAVTAAQWTTSDSLTATVSQSGVVLARRVGTATIIATSRANPTLANAARLTVE